MAKSKKLIKTEIIDTLSNLDLSKEDLSRILEFIEKKEYREVSLFKVFTDDKFAQNVCISYRHDFGLLDEAKRSSLVFEYNEWTRAILNNLIYY